MCLTGGVLADGSSLYAYPVSEQQVISFLCTELNRIIHFSLLSWFRCFDSLILKPSRGSQKSDLYRAIPKTPFLNFHFIPWKFVLLLCENLPCVYLWHVELQSYLSANPSFSCRPQIFYLRPLQTHVFSSCFHLCKRTRFLLYRRYRCLQRVFSVVISLW